MGGGGGMVAGAWWVQVSYFRAPGMHVGVSVIRLPWYHCPWNLVGVAQPDMEGVSIVYSPGHLPHDNPPYPHPSPPCRTIADNVIYPGAPDLLAYLARGDGSGSDESSSGSGTAAPRTRQYEAVVVPAQYEYDQVCMRMLRTAPVPYLRLRIKQEPPRDPEP